MRRIHKITAVVFLSGVLLSGIGAGVTLAELNSMSYGGQVGISDEDIITEKLEYTVKEEYKDCSIGIHTHWANPANVEFVEKSEDFPDDKVIFEISYNYKEIEPEIYEDIDTDYLYEEVYEGEDGSTHVKKEYKDRISLSLNYIYKDSYDFLDTFIKVKNHVMEGLKNGKLYSYDGRSVRAVKIYISENLKDRVIY